MVDGPRKLQHRRPARYAYRALESDDIDGYGQGLQVQYGVEDPE